MANYKLLDEFVYYCTRCKMELNHQITAADEGIPKRVMCLTCKSERKYHEKKPGAARRGPVKRTTAAATRAQKEAQESQWRLMIADKSVTPKTYTMETVFTVNDAVYHSVFGRGVVAGIVAPDKVHVFFEEGLKLLRCGKG